MNRGWLRRLTAQHVSEEDLLLHLDGALSDRKAEAVSRHLRDCWTCRSQKERLQSGN